MQRAVRAKPVRKVQLVRAKRNMLVNTLTSSVGQNRTTVVKKKRPSQPVKRHSGLSLRARVLKCKKRPDNKPKAVGAGMERRFVPWCS